MDYFNNSYTFIFCTIYCLSSEAMITVKTNNYVLYLSIVINTKIFKTNKIIHKYVPI